MAKMRNVFLNNVIPPLPNPDFEPRVELTSMREAIIEGCKAIVEYNDTKAVINCRNMTMEFCGFNLNIKTVSSDIMIISGKITNINFCQR